MASSISMAAPARAGDDGGRESALPRDTLYVESNDPTPGQNSVLAYHRNRDGSLTALAGSPFLTGGTGFVDPTFAVGPFDGQNIMVADPGNGVIFVPNGGSDTIAALRAAPDGSLKPVRGSPFAMSGNTPEALGLRGRTLVVVNNASDPNQAASGIGPSYLTMRLNESDQLSEVPSSTVPLAAGSLPTEALPSPYAPLVYTNEFPKTLASYFLDGLGRLHLIQRQSPPQESSETAAPAPLGQALNPVAPFLYVALANVSRLAVYDTSSFETKFIRSVGNSGKAICWVRVTKDGRTLYTSNTGDNSLSVYDLTQPDNPIERQRLTLNNAPGNAFDFALSPDERFIYVTEEEDSVAALGLSNKIHILSVERNTGLLAETAASPVKLPVAGGHRIQGILVY